MSSPVNVCGCVTDVFEISSLMVTPSSSLPPSPVGPWLVSIQATVHCLLTPTNLCPAQASHSYLPDPVHFELIPQLYDVDLKPVGQLMPKILGASWVSAASGDQVFMDPADALQTDFQSAAGT